MTYAQTSPRFKEAERTFSRGRVTGSVSAEYEPSEIVYHASFWRQYRAKLILYGILQLWALMSVVALFIVFEMETPRVVVANSFYLRFFMFTSWFSTPLGLLGLPAPIMWRRRYLALRDISEALEAPADAHVLASLE